MVTVILLVNYNLQQLIAKTCLQRPLSVRCKAFYSDVENICRTASFHLNGGKGGGGAHKTSYTSPLFVDVPLTSLKENDHVIVCKG